MPATGAETGNPITMILPFVLMIALFYFMIIRPQKKKEKETRAMLDALKPGDSVTTVGGIVGTILRIKDDKVCIEIGDRTHKHPMTIKREAIASAIPCTKKSKKIKAEELPEEVETEATEETKAAE